MTMSIGARNLRRRLQALPSDAPVGDLVRAAGAAMSDVGGAIGPLYSAALGAIAAEIAVPTAGRVGDIAQLRRAAETAERAISDLGHASPGDKTVLDAFHPLVLLLRDSESDGRAVGPALEAAIAAAQSGAADTAEMVARIGRASRLGERSRGLPDAGATSFAIIVRAMVDAYRQAHSTAEKA